MRCARLPCAGLLHRAVVVTSLILTLGLALTGTDRAAEAHAVLLESTPADGAVLERAPPAVMLRFNEPIAPVTLRVLDVAAKVVADGAQAQVENERITLPLPADLPSATYVISYRVISIDSHPVSGAIVFSVGEAPASVGERPPNRQDRMTSAAVVAVRAMFLAALLLATGWVAALWRVAQFDAATVRRHRRALAITIFATLVLGTILLGLTGCDIAGSPLGGLREPRPWRLALASSLAQSLAVAATGLVLVLISLPWLARGGNRLVPLAGSLLAVASLALTGHAASAAPQWLTRTMVPVHAASAAFWLGSLPLLAASLRCDPAERARRYVLRFSIHAAGAVALLVGCGVVLALIQVEHFAMLWQTTYGVVLLAKVGAVLLLLALAATNKWWLTPRIGQDATAIRSLRRSIFAEYLLFFSILGLTAVLMQIEPPRTGVTRDIAATATQAADFAASAAEAGIKVTLSVSPARAGHNAIAVSVADQNGQPLAPQEVALELALPEAGIEPLRRSATRTADGWFLLHGNELTLMGEWRVTVHVLVDDFTKKTFTFVVPIR